jgi:putative protease
MQVDAMTLPVEYSKEDLIALLSQTKQTNWEFVIYGRQALMVTAQCTYRNVGCCFKNRSHTAPTQQIEASGQLLLKNQFGDEFQVERICKYCYNVIYQTCPNCYFQVMQELPLEQIRTYRIHFTNESAEEAKERMNYRMPEQSITGRFRKGIE